MVIIMTFVTIGIHRSTVTFFFLFTAKDSVRIDIGDFMPTSPSFFCELSVCTFSGVVVWILCVCVCFLLCEAFGVFVLHVTHS